MLRGTALFREATGDSSLRSLMDWAERTSSCLWGYRFEHIMFNAEALAPIGCNRKYFAFW